MLFGGNECFVELHILLLVKIAVSSQLVVWRDAPIIRVSTLKVLLSNIIINYVFYPNTVS